MGQRSGVELLISLLTFTVIILALIGFGGLDITAQHAEIQDAEVTEGSVELTSTEQRFGRYSTFSRYETYVRYTYTVDGTEYTSTRITPEGSSNPRYPFESWARDRANEYDGTVTVYYDPDDPEKAYLDRRYSFTPYLFYVSGWVLFGLFLSASAIASTVVRVFAYVPGLRRETPLGTVGSVAAGCCFWAVIVGPVVHFWLVSAFPVRLTSAVTTFALATLIAVDVYRRYTVSSDT